jgi:pilus assembly protein CpaF
MKEQLEQPAALADIPMFAEYDEEPSPPTPAAGDGQPFGVYSAEELRSSRTSLPAADLDWTQVVDLRRRASEIITDEAEEYARASGRPLAGEDRLLLGRSIIRRVVGDHVRSLHRSGDELWSPAQEEAYVTAVEDAIFGYGRLQPLLEMPDVENIEIHGWDSVVVQHGDGRRRQMPPVADSDEELIEAVRFLGQNIPP